MLGHEHLRFKTILDHMHTREEGGRDRETEGQRHRHRKTDSHTETEIGTSEDRGYHK